MLRTDPWSILRGGVLWAVTAEIEPSGSAWLPWPGRMSRWWYEITAVDIEGTNWTWAYEPGGSGGGFTLRACLRRAMRAIDGFEDAGKVG